MILDGAMGTMIQRHRLSEAQFRGERFAAWRSDLRGNNDLLAITQPQIIGAIHREYLLAGADVISTNTFNSTAVSQADYGMEALVGELNLAAARVARQAADEVSAETGRQRFVAGALGPTSRTASLSPDVNDPGFRNISFDELVAGYTEASAGADRGRRRRHPDRDHVRHLERQGGAVRGARRAGRGGHRSAHHRLGHDHRCIGQHPVGPDHRGVLEFDSSCAARRGRDSIARSAAGSCGPTSRSCRASPTPTCAPIPNAGLPNAFGEYDETPAETAAILREFAASGFVNMVGGCCGTTPDHIRAIARRGRRRARRACVPSIPRACRLSGLEPLTIDADSLFVNVGERTNVTGSAKFRKLIEAGDYAAAVDIARQQVANGAQIIDVNMDEGMLDSQAAMTRLLEPDRRRARYRARARDDRFLEVVGDRGGPEVRAGQVHRQFDQPEGRRGGIPCACAPGACATARPWSSWPSTKRARPTRIERKVAICERAYRLLTERIGFAPEDIIFDPNIFAVATGIEEHNRYSLDFIEATAAIKERMPAVHVSGGVSNVSFSFRGNDPVREAMHSVFLYHAIRAGLTMGIVNAGQLAIYEDIPPDLRERCRGCDSGAARRCHGAAARDRRAVQGRRRVRSAAMTWSGASCRWRSACSMRSSRASTSSCSRTPKRRGSRPSGRSM